MSDGIDEAIVGRDIDSETSYGYLILSKGVMLSLLKDNFYLYSSCKGFIDNAECKSDIVGSDFL